VRALAVADSDSYLKWSAATLAALPTGWQTEQVVIKNPIAPSQAQMHAAVGRPIATLSLPKLIMKVLRERPDVLVLGCTGPVVRALVELPLFRLRRRPILLTGLPGISIPATERAVALRSGCDLLVVHSHRERAEFAELAAELAPQLQIGLARLPFLDHDPQLDAAAGPTPRTPAEPPADVVFAAQAKVPASWGHRRLVLSTLARLPSGMHPVVKLRADAGEEQTHREQFPYPEVYAALLARGELPEDRTQPVRFSSGAMSVALASAAGFVTVSSTSALEAISHGVDVVILSDFGVSAETINVVFEGSDCLGTLDDVANGRFFRPDQIWMRQNYFHPEADSDWLEKLWELTEQRRAGGLPVSRVRPSGSAASRWRRLLRLLLPEAAWSVLRRVRSSLPRHR
jgi:hypothetical protein